MDNIARIVLSAVFVAGVATSVNAQKVSQIASPSGVVLKYVKCSRSAAKCMNKAAKKLFWVLSSDRFRKPFGWYIR